MSVIARSPDGTIRLYCKGSDAKASRSRLVLEPRCGPDQPALRMAWHAAASTPAVPVLCLCR